MHKCIVSTSHLVFNSSCFCKASQTNSAFKLSECKSRDIWRCDEVTSGNVNYTAVTTASSTEHYRKEILSRFWFTCLHASYNCVLRSALQEGDLVTFLVHLPDVQLFVFLDARLDRIRFEALRGTTFHNVAHLDGSHTAALWNHLLDWCEDLVSDVLNPVMWNKKWSIYHLLVHCLGWFGKETTNHWFIALLRVVLH